MSEKEEKIPIRRFKEFEHADAWEQRKLGELANIVRGASPRPIQDPKWFDDESDVGWLRIADVTEQDGRIHHLEQHISKLGQEKTRVLTEPHLLLSIAATVGKPVVNYVKTGVHDGFLIFLEPKFNRVFMFQWLEMFRPKWQKYGQPGSQVNLNSDLVKNQEIALPREEEQQKIGAYFAKLDHLITLHQRKLEKIKSLKKAYLSEMFPAKGECKPKRRFAGYTDAWEQRKLLDCIEKIVDFRGRTPKKLGMDWSESGYLALSALNVKDGYIDFTQDVHYGNQELYDKWMIGNELHKGQVLFTTEAPMGNVAQVPDNRQYILCQRTIAFNVKEDLITENFLATILRSPNVIATLTALSSGGTAKGVSQKSLSTVEIIIPNDLGEQERLANVFLELNHLITLHQRKLEKLQSLKQAYLNEMFV